MLTYTACLFLQARQRREADAFAAVEHGVVSQLEGELAGEVVRWRSEAEEAGAQLADVRRRLVDTDAALLARDEEVG